MQIRYNHERRILSRTYSPKNAVNPGLFIEFQYNKKKTSDPKPLIFVLWNDKLYQSKGKKDLIHGININYLTDHVFKKVFSETSRKKTNKIKDLIIL